MGPQYSIDDAFRLFKDRAGTRGVSSNVSPDRFNRWFNSAELKFFNTRYDEYAVKQTISDSISKWMTDPMFIPVDSNGFFRFFDNMSLLHVDSMSAYLWPGILTATAAGSTTKPDGVYSNLSAITATGYGAGATFNITIASGIATVITPVNAGQNYAVGDTFYFGAIQGLTFTVATTTGTMIAKFGTFTGGTLYVDGIYPNVPLTGGTGTGATALFVVSGGIVKTCIPMLQGTDYVIGDSLSASNANFGGVGSGFSVLVASLTDGNGDYPVTRVEKQRWASNLNSEYDSPTQEFPIYTQFATSFQFAPNIGFAKIVYLQQPVWSFWGYVYAGYIATLTGLTGGTLYTTGTYTNVPLTGGNGNGALATVVVAGGAVTSVTITGPGKLYQVGDVLSALAANIGGTGSGFSIAVSSLVSGSIRAVYNAATSVQPRWNNDDISTIVDLALQDAAQAARDPELRQFANDTSKIQQ